MMKKNKYSTIIAIDPDVDGSGVAVYDCAFKVLATLRYGLPVLAKFLEGYHAREDVIVVVEASYLVNSNWHLEKCDSKRKAAATGRNVGRNHEIGRQIVEFCKYYNIPYEEKIPLKKIWHGRDGKITKVELESLCKGSGVGYKFAGNDQEQRDAALLALDYSNIPLIMAPQKK